MIKVPKLHSFIYWLEFKFFYNLKIYRTLSNMNEGDETIKSFITETLKINYRDTVSLMGQAVEKI